MRNITTFEGSRRVTIEGAPLQCFRCGSYDIMAMYEATGTALVGLQCPSCKVEWPLKDWFKELDFWRNLGVLPKNWTGGKG